MANVEKSGTMKYKDKSGNMTTMYPKTKVANVEGLEEKLADATDVFWATYNTTTYAEVKAAYDAKKDVMILYDERIYRVSSFMSSTLFTFTNTDGTKPNEDDGETIGTGNSRIILLWDTVGWLGPYLVRNRPKDHASTHATGGADPITPASIGAATITEVNTAIQSAIQNTWEASY